jgi:hypothetical protein
LKPIHYVSLTIGLVWLAADVRLVVSNIILRETPVGMVATFLDKLPPKVSDPIFIFLWITLLLGWLVLVGFGVKPLFRRWKAKARNSVHSPLDETSAPPGK